jgi:ferredoxin-nitrate reductase
MTRSQRDSIEDIWGPRTPYEGEGQWPVRVDERTTDTPERWVQSACVLCSNGCALDIGVKDNRIVGVRGRAIDRINRGRLGPKGLHGWIANHAGDRLTEPMIKTGGRQVTATWDRALETVSSKLRDVLAEHGPGAIGFYNSGQLFLEEYYALAVLARLGIKTNHLDGNTRLCTSTAAMALIESFGTDGDPGSYEDIDVTDAILLVGHNLAETQTVLWARVLDRRRGPRPPKLVVIDPRRTPTAKEADVHLAPKLGTNVAVLNGLLHILIERGWYDVGYVQQHTVGFQELRATVADYPAKRVAAISGVPVDALEAAATIIGRSGSLVSTCLQGVYQSNQATAAAVQVNNINLIRGMIGKPGSTVFQMNGQPTAQNTRECGANGELAAFFNWNNEEHVARYAAHFGMQATEIPHYAPPTPIMKMMRYAEEGSLRVLWIIATNPAVTLPDLPRIRKILEKQNLFVIVQDPFMTETGRLADVVLPTAIWGEKTGTFTNADRTVHLSRKAIEPPAGVRSDFEIFVDVARRLDLRTAGGEPVMRFSEPEQAFTDFAKLTRGRPCDYSGLSYAKLEGSGIQWPCNEAHPQGKARLYTDGTFNTSADDCETWGHDLETGGALNEREYRAQDPKGRARLRAAAYQAPEEEPDATYPFFLTTGRIVYHFHTRTKTGKSEELNAAAPDAWVEMHERDAAKLGFSNGEMVEVQTRRGTIVVKLRVADVLEGQLFVPFHYGYWDDPMRPRAANELTLATWDPVSKQPSFKLAAARVRRAGDR